VTGAPARPFGEGEQVVLALRPHRQALVPPALVLLLVSPTAAFTAAATPAGALARTNQFSPPSGASDGVVALEVLT